MASDKGGFRGRVLSLNEIKMKAARNAAAGRSMLPMNRLRPERGHVLAGNDTAPAGPMNRMLDAVAAEALAKTKADADSDDTAGEPAATEREPIVHEGGGDDREDFPKIELREQLGLVRAIRPGEADLPTSTVPFVDRVAYAVINVGAIERITKRQLMVAYPDGRTERLGELLLELGEYLMAQEEDAPKILVQGTYPTGGMQ